MHIRNVLIVVAVTAGLFLVNGFNRWIALLGILAFIREAVFNEPIPDIEVPKLTSKQDTSAKPDPTKRICVVTGGAGNLAAIFIPELLKKGTYDVIRALDIVKPNFTDPKVENHKVSILDGSGLYRAFEGVETVYHMASLTDLREEAHHQYQLRLINVVGCQNVVNACIRRGVKKMVYTSSANAFVEGKPMVLSEKACEGVLAKNLLSTYGRTKLEAERLVLAANNHCGLKTIALRPFMIYGENDRFFVDIIAKGTFVFSNNLFSAVYSRNLAHWHWLADQALDKKPEVTAGRAYFVCDGPDDVTKAQLTQDLIEATNPKNKVPLDPRILMVMSAILPWVDWLTCGQLKGEPLQITASALYSSFEDHKIDASEGVRDLGYVRPYSREKTIESVRENYTKKQL